MKTSLESLANDRKFTLGKVKENLVLAGTSLLGSAGLASVMPTIYSAVLNSPDVDKLPHYYTLAVMTGITVGLPVIGVYCLKEVYKEAKTLARENL